LINVRGIFQKMKQRRLALEKDLAAALLQQRRVADELERIA